MWRWLISVVSLVTAALAIYAYLVPGGTDGASMRLPAGTHDASLIVAPSSPAAAAGLHTGDRVDLNALSMIERWEHASLRNTGDRLRYPLTGSQNVTVVTTIAPFPKNAALQTTWFEAVGTVWIALFAVLLSWRRANEPNVRLLIFALLFSQLGGLLWRNNLYLPNVALSAVLDECNKLINAASIVLLLVYVRRYASSSFALTLASALTYVFCAGHVLFGIVQIVAIFFGFAWAQIVALPIEQTSFTLALLCSAVAVALALPLVDPKKRSAAAWAALPLAAFNFVEASAVLFTWVSASALPGLVLPFAVIFNVFSFILPLGLTYAVFSRRVADIGFALNRAAIYSGVSIVVVVLFVLLEWFTGELVGHTNARENVIVSASIALALGLSLRFIHSNVERFIDRVLFSKRRADEEAIRQLAREAPFITKPDTLIERTIAALERHAGASFATVLLRDMDGRFSGVDENDPALVRLRADARTLDVHSIHTALAGEKAFPMIVRGALIGAIVIGSKSTEEHYAPDEVAAIEALAHSVATSIDALERSNDERSVAGMLAEMQLLLREIHASIATTLKH